jgi:hypothetical protein
LRLRLGLLSSGGVGSRLKRCRAKSGCEFHCKHDSLTTYNENCQKSLHCKYIRFRLLAPTQAETKYSHSKIRVKRHLQNGHFTLVSIFLSTARLSCPPTMKPTLPTLFFLPLILLLSTECRAERETTCATLSNNTFYDWTSSLNRRSPFLADSFPDEASSLALSRYGNGWLTYFETDPKVYGITLTRKGRGTITTVPLKGWIHVVFNLPSHIREGESLWVPSFISYLHK